MRKFVDLNHERPANSLIFFYWRGSHGFVSTPTIGIQRTRVSSIFRGRCDDIDWQNNIVTALNIVLVDAPLPLEEHIVFYKRHWYNCLCITKDISTWFSEQVEKSTNPELQRMRPFVWNENPYFVDTGKYVQQGEICPFPQTKIEGG